MQKIKPNSNKKTVSKKKKKFEINTKDYDGKEQIVIDFKDGTSLPLNRIKQMFKEQGTASETFLGKETADKILKFLQANNPTREEFVEYFKSTDLNRGGTMLGQQMEMAFMQDDRLKASKGTDVPKPEVIELDEHIDAYKKKYGLTDEEVIEILRSFAPPKAKQNNEGGLQEQGGSKDPVSGNDVPIGSLKEEVRDDIPAMLSEGEFVFPADVTRYYGLDTLMKMRQKAKQGLKVMEAMGQMGNSEEATIPDDIPFDMDDLELAEGGVVKAQQGIYLPPEINPPTTTQQPGFGTAPTLFPMNQKFTLPVQPDLPPPTVPDPKPPLSFQDLLGTAAYDELRSYVNDDGKIIQIKFKQGKPLETIPEGYRPLTQNEGIKPTFTTATNIADSGSSRVAMPSVQQQKVADDLLLGTDEQIARGETPAVTGVKPKGAAAFKVDDFENYLKVKSPSGSMGIDYASGKNTKTFALDPLPEVGGKALGKAGDFMDAGVGRVLPGVLTRMSDRAIRETAADRLLAGEYADDREYNVLRNIVELEPKKASDLALFKAADSKELTKKIERIRDSKTKEGKYDPKVAEAHVKNKEKFDTALRAEKEKRGAVYDKRGNKIRNETTSVEMTRMMITNDPTRESAIMMGESNSAREERERKEADAMRRAADMDAFANREDERRADNVANTNFSEPTASEQTHCCTASYKQKTMTISEVKELRRWHRQQSQIWQDGYDVWGKYVADGLVAKSKWQASVVKSVHQLIIKKKLTLKGLYGIILISSGVYPIGLFKRIMRYGRIFQST